MARPGPAPREGCSGSCESGGAQRAADVSFVWSPPHISPVPLQSGVGALQQLGVQFARGWLYTSERIGSREFANDLPPWASHGVRSQVERAVGAPVPG
jgi:hypothetical protein